MLKRIIIWVLLGLIYSAGGVSAADVCVAQNQRCLTTQNVTVGGVVLHNVCTSVERTETCTRAAPVNNCTTLQPVTVSGANPLTNGQCELVSETCISSVAGLCDKNKRIYHCWNGPPQGAPATLDARTFLNFTETIDNNCAAQTGNPNCALQQTVVTQGYGTRNFNQKNVTRSWWAQERQYDCTNNIYSETCQPFTDAPFCTQTGAQTCLAYAPDGTCEYAELTFNCVSDSSFQASCDAVNVCVGGNCEGIAQDASSDYPKAAAWLNFLDDTAKGNFCNPLAGTNSNLPVTVADCTNGTLDAGNTKPEVFGGQSMGCFMDAFANCCANPGSSYCGQEPKDLRTFQNAGTTHQLGQRCTSWFLGICVSYRREYCVYKSRFARVFQEQVNLSTNAQFKWQQAVECPALTMDQLATVDVNTMDLSEVFGDMLNSTSVPVQQLVMDKISTEVGGYGPQINGTFQ